METFLFLAKEKSNLIIILFSSYINDYYLLSAMALDTE